MSVVIQGGSERLILTVLLGIHSAVGEFRWFAMLLAWILTSRSDSESQSVPGKLALTGHNRLCCNCERDV